MTVFDRDKLNSLANRRYNGDEDVIDDLTQAGYELVDFVITWKRIFLPPREGTEEDLMQEGMIGFLEAVRNWTPGKQRFHDFAINCVYRELIGTITKLGRQFRRAQLNAISLDNGRDGHAITDVFAFTDHSGLSADPAEIVTETNASIALASFTECLSELERDVFVRAVVGEESYLKIAASLGISKKSVDNALQRAKRKLARHIRSNSQLDRSA